MIVKAYTGDGCWEMWQALGSVQFLGHHTEIAVKVLDPDILDHDFWADARFPTDDVGMMMFHPVGQAFCEGGTDQDTTCTRFFGWVKWYDTGASDTLMLVTDGPVYICNDAGDTIEAIRANVNPYPVKNDPIVA